MLEKIDDDSINGFKYKLNDLKVFGSKENLKKTVKKYRKVFHELESRYIYCELSFYNKNFDVVDWTAQVKFVCTDILNGKKVCELNKVVRVSRDRNLIYVREGWGTPEPGWWKHGSYIWEVYINEEHLGITEFHIIAGEEITIEDNSYFDIDSIRLFESPREGAPLEVRSYLKQFAGNQTKYINVEVSLSNILTHEDQFPLELQFNFYNKEGKHKAFMSYFKQITGQKSVVLDTGYGSDTVGFWSEDEYTLEVTFMENVIAVLSFEVGKESIPFMEHTMHEQNDHSLDSIFELPEEITFEDAKKELDELIGLRKVKAQINELATYMKFLKIRQDKGLTSDEKVDLHSLFIGNPGTGKTTVAKMLGKIYKSLGLLTHGKVFEVGRADLVGEFIGQTAPKVKKMIEKARGGILFIDEAYALTDRGDDGKDFGREVIEVLLKELSDGPGNISIVCAGYQKEMEHFIDSNPGLASRFNNNIQFPDYTPDELLAIANFSADKKGVKLESQANKVLYKKLIEKYRDRDNKFGNARYVDSLLEEAKQNLALRVMEQNSDAELLPTEALSIIEKEDIEKIFKRKSNRHIQLPIDKELLQETLAALHELVGLEDIKTQVDEMVKLVKYYNEIGKDVMNAFQMHTVFIGQPGTGKTTVARLLVQLYKALGVLERGHLVETDRKGLIAGYVGQTAIKTGELIEKSIGGGLFIDEAYGLTEDNNSYGKEAIEVLLKEMEDKRGEFMVIVAGYPKKMKNFLESNPGLMSRFDKQFVFKDYTTDELLMITKSLFDKEELRLEDDAEQHIRNFIHQMIENKSSYFGNARSVRKLVFESIKNQNLRMAGVDSKQRDWISIHTIKYEDVCQIELIENQKDDNHRKIGF